MGCYIIEEEEGFMKKQTKIAILFILVALQGLIIAVGIKAAVGVSAWDALNLSVSQLSGVKIGTTIIIMNGLFVVLQFFMLRSEFGISHLLQMAVIFIFGVFINFTTDYILTMEFNNYYLRLITYIVSVSLSAYNLGAILALDIVSFPAEGFCRVYSDKYGANFTKVRFTIDVVSIVLSLAITFFFKLPLVVREGTIIGALLFSPILGYSLEKHKSLIK